MSNETEAQQALEAINLLRELEIESPACVALHYIGHGIWQAYDTLDSEPIADGLTPLEALRSAEKRLMSGGGK